MMLRSVLRANAVVMTLLLGVAPLLPAATPQSRFDAAIAEGRREMQSMIDRGTTPGAAVAVAVDGRVVWTEGFGFGDLEARTPADADTRFGIGSISKSLTMTAAVKLADRGILDLDAPLERYLPDFPQKGRGVTIRRIAAHQSGLSDQFAAEHYMTRRHFTTVAEAYEAMRDAPLVYGPGTRTAYATGLYTFIARAMERATGKPYLDIMRDEIFGPAKLAIVANDMRSDLPRRTRFYANRKEGGFERAAFTDPSFKLAGAGFLATARDIAAFGAALLDHAFLSDAARRELFTPVPLADGTSTEFALGFRVRTDSAGTVIHLPGGGVGISSWLFIHPSERLVVGLVGNVNTAPVGGHAYREILAAFRRAEIVAAP